MHSAWYGRRTMQHLHRRLLYRQSDHSIWAFGGKQLKNARLHLASYAQIKIGWKKGASRPLLVCKKTYSTGYSQAVTHPSTNSAQCCLTSVIRREPVHSAWYGRRTMQHLHRRLLYRQSDHSIWAFGGKQLKNVTLHLASYAQIKIGWKRGISPIAGMQKDLQHWVFPGGHPSKY